MALDGMWLLLAVAVTLTILCSPISAYSAYQLRMAYCREMEVTRPKLHQDLNLKEYCTIRVQQFEQKVIFV